MKTKCALLLSIFCSSSFFLSAERPAGGKAEVKTARDILPKVTAPAEVLRIQEQLQKAVVFVDSETGELRMPQEGEHQALTGAGQRRIAAAATAPITLPSGGAALRFDASKLQFTVVTKNRDGSISHSHRTPTPLKGGDNAK